MLLELRVKGLGIIEEINWSLGHGLNVITGETGAGKSLVIDAVEALLAGKADEEDIRHGTNAARIEGVFALPQNEGISQLRELLEENGLGDVEETLVIACDLQRQKRSISRVNSHAVPRLLLQQIGRSLVDIHGQSEHLSLLDKKKHLYFLDSYAHTLDLKYEFGARAAELYKTEQELKALADEEKDRARREELLRFQSDEIRQTKLKQGEEEELEAERNVLSSTEKLKTLAYEVCHAISGEDIALSSSLDKLNEAVQAMKKLADLDPSLKQQLGLLEETFFGLEEVSRDIRSYGEKLEYNPEQLEVVESRLDLIRNLKRKYGQTINEVLDYQIKAEEELEGLSHSSMRRTDLEELQSSLRKEMGQMASELSQARSQSVGQLTSEVKRELQDLNMSQVEFEVAITRVQAQQEISLPDGETCAFNNEGVDSVEFIASTNPGEPLKPLAKIASTGEISRFMLALKGALSQADNIPVLIFDEIDIGVGGRSGEIIGRKLWTLARNRQVICVTHLPQIAAFADEHYSVHKEISGDRTSSILEALHDESQIRELAIMLAGPQYTNTATDSARELIHKAEAWKKAS